jgi:hypothetical protein
MIRQIRIIEMQCRAFDARGVDISYVAFNSKMYLKLSWKHHRYFFMDLHVDMMISELCNFYTEWFVKC